MEVIISGDRIDPVKLWRYDCGQTLKFRGLKVPDGTELQLYQGEGKDEYSTRTFVADRTAAVPDYLLLQLANITAYLYIVRENGGQTVRKINITVQDRPMPADYVDPIPPVDYSRLLPPGGEDGDTLVYGLEGPYWESNPGKLVQWESITGKPDAFPPAEHQHPASAVSFDDGMSFQQKYNSGELRGQQGQPGKDGADGAQGIQGIPGRDGTDGADGKPGADGLPGTNGRDGTDGQQGEPGKDGADGRDGEKGESFDPADLRRIDNALGGLQSESAANKEATKALEQNLEASNQANERKYANAPIGTVSGIGSVTVSDAWGAPVVDLGMGGKSEQFTTTGAQLFDASKLSTRTINEATVTNSGDGSFTITGSGTITENFSNLIYLTHEESVQRFPSGTYKLSTNGILSAPYFLFKRYATGGSSEINNRTTSSLNSELVITDEMVADANYGIQIGFWLSVGSAIVPGTFKPLVYKKTSNAVPDWEPYTGGVASPNLQFPQDANSVENPVVVSSVGGRNYIPKSSFRNEESFKKIGTSPYGNRELINGEFVRFKKTEATGSRAVFYFNAIDLWGEFDVGERVTFSAWIYMEEITTPADVLTTIALRTPRADGTLLDKPAINLNNISLNQWIQVSKTETVTESMKEKYPYSANFIIGLTTGTCTLRVRDVKLERSDVATPWTPAPEDITDTNREELSPYINVISLAGYTFRGIDDIRDHLEHRGGVRGIADYLEEKIFDGTEAWAVAYTTGNSVRFRLGLIDLTQYRFLAIKSNYFKPLYSASDIVGRVFVRTDETTVRYDVVFSLGFLENDNAEGLKKWLAARYAEGNPVMVIHEKITPTWEPLPDDLQRQLNNLRTFPGEHSTIYTISDVTPGLEVEYIQDTNKVVRNLKLEMAEQSVNTLAAIEQLKITNNLS